MSSRSSRLTFPGSLGYELAARLDMPVAGVRAYALFAHCFTCTKDIFAARRVAGTLASLGVAVLRFDFTGLGSSEGEFQNTSFSSNVEDLVRAADHLRAHYRAPAIAIGHSLGGAAVLAAAHRMPEAQAVVTIGAPSDVAQALVTPSMPPRAARRLQLTPHVRPRGSGRSWPRRSPWPIRKRTMLSFSCAHCFR